MMLLVLRAADALDLQMDRADVRLQGAGPPERDAYAVAKGAVGPLSAA